MSKDSDVKVRTEKLFNKIRTELKPGLDDTIQTELARIVNLLADINDSNDLCLIASAEIAASALLTDSPNQKLAQAIIEDLDRQLRANRTSLILFRSILSPKTPSTRVVLGLGLLLYILIPLAILYMPRLTAQQEIFGIDASLLLLVAIAGTIGSIVSIMIRVQDFKAFAHKPNNDPTTFFFIGFFKPIVGLAFAVFIFAVLKAGIIPITIASVTERYFFLALAFVAGFSERFAKDVVSKTENQFSTSDEIKTKNSA